MKIPTGLRSAPAMISEPTPAFDMPSSALRKGVSGTTEMGEREPILVSGELSVCCSLAR